MIVSGTIDLFREALCDIPWLILAVGSVIIYNASLVIYRLYFHPLRHIPGPWIAAATQWYEFYYDVLQWPGGQYIHKVDAMHDRYGTLVDIERSITLLIFLQVQSFA